MVNPLLSRPCLFTTQLVQLKTDKAIIITERTLEANGIPLKQGIERAFISGGVVQVAWVRSIWSSEEETQEFADDLLATRMR